MPLPPPPTRCDHCKHWDKDEQCRAGELRVGWCHKAIQWWDATEWCDSDDDSPYENNRRVLPEYDGTKMFVQDASDCRAELYTTADFFCAHFEAGEPSGLS